MAEQAIRQYDPAKPKRAINIPDAQWAKHKRLIENMRSRNFTRAQMLQILRTQHDFSPSMSQLDARLGRWANSHKRGQGLTVDVSHQLSPIPDTWSPLQPASAGSPESVTAKAPTGATAHIPQSKYVGGHMMASSVSLVTASSLTDDTMILEALSKVHQAAYGNATKNITRTSNVNDQGKREVIRGMYSTLVAELSDIQNATAHPRTNKELSAIKEVAEILLPLEDAKIPPLVVDDVSSTESHSASPASSTSPLRQVRGPTEEQLALQVVINLEQAIAFDKAMNLPRAVDAYSNAYDILAKLGFRQDMGEHQMISVHMSRKHVHRLREILASDSYKHLLRSLGKIPELRENPVSSALRPLITGTAKRSSSNSLPLEWQTPSYEHGRPSKQASTFHSRTSAREVQQWPEGDALMRTTASDLNDTTNSTDDGDVEMEDALPRDHEVQYTQDNDTVEHPNAHTSGTQFMASWEDEFYKGRLEQVFSSNRLPSLAAISSLPPSSFVLHDDLNFPTDARGPAITLPEALEQIEETHEEYRSTPQMPLVPRFPLRANEEPFNALTRLKRDIVEDAYLPPMPPSNRSSRASLGRPSLRSLLSVFARDKNVDRTSKHSTLSKRMSTASVSSFHSVTGFARMSFGRQSNVPSMMSVDD